MIGFYGRSGAQIDKVGFIIQKTIKIPVITEVDSNDDTGSGSGTDSDECQENCLLPAYIGSGYDILQGNPDNEDSFDPGFRSRVFQYTY